MDSGPLLGDGGAREEEGKSYTGKPHNNSGNPSGILNRPQPLVAAAADNSPSRQRVLPVESDDSSSRNPVQPGVNRREPSTNPNEVPGYVKFDNFVKISFNLSNKDEIRALKSKLSKELDQVMSAMKRLEAKQMELGKTVDKHAMRKSSEPANPRAFRELTVSINENEKNHGGGKPAEKKKSAPKVSQNYKNSDAVMEKKLGQMGSNKKLKPNEMGSVFVSDKDLSRLWKNCGNLLDKLMKHKYGWVFNKPVDVKGLGLHDYYTIIKHPMDLGTVKNKLSKHMYKSPIAFAEDVRLTFDNAMLYNPKGQDVHVMAEQLSNIFEEKWRSIEADYNLCKRMVTGRDPSFPKPKPKKVSTGPPQQPLGMGNLERVGLVTEPANPNAKAVNSAHRVKKSVPMKSKAREQEKRDMTYEEKQRLSIELQDLPAEELQKVVDIIRKKFPVSPHDEEIEVDIDCFDPETLWELDLFVNDYKKTLNNTKRKAEFDLHVTLEDNYYVQDSVRTSIIS